MNATKHLLLAVFFAISAITQAQNPKDASAKIKIAVMGIDSKELLMDSESLGKLARLKLQKDDRYAVFREYDVKEQFSDRLERVQNCYSVQCLTELGAELGADQMLSGAAERFGERIVISLIIVDVETGQIIASDVNEYYNLGGEMEGMIAISINNLLDQENDPRLENALVRSETTLSEQVVERLKLNGPRMGIAYVTGLRGQRLQDPSNENGFDMLPFMSQFGYQFEWQYLSAGNMQALIEVVPLISGMDQQMFLPSVTMMNGFRHSGTGIEIAFGPTLSLGKMAEGFYDETNTWQRKENWVAENSSQYKSGLHDNFDSKGSTRVNYSFTLAAGRTFRSGHLNIPVNVYYSPSKHGGLVGASFGFNIRKK